MKIELNFRIPNTGLTLDRMQAAGLDVQSVSTTVVVAGDAADEDAVRLAAWQYSTEMIAWREQRAVELARVDALMRRDESQKRLSLPGMTDEQILAWEQYAQALRDGPGTVTAVGELPTWPTQPE